MCGGIHFLITILFVNNLVNKMTRNSIREPIVKWFITIITIINYR